MILMLSMIVSVAILGVLSYVVTSEYKNEIHVNEDHLRIIEPIPDNNDLAESVKDKDPDEDAGSLSNEGILNNMYDPVSEDDADGEDTLGENKIGSDEEEIDEIDPIGDVTGRYENGQLIGLDPTWEFSEYSQINSGSAVFYRSRRSPKGIIVSVNAGHGTKGGDKAKTYCHPDKTEKVTGGSTAKGSIMATAVSGGMTFNDGTPEAAVTLQMAQILRDKLLDAGYDVLMIRDGDDVQLDNVARTVISNNIADCHIAIHWDGDSQNTDKGCFYISIPDQLKEMYPVSNVWQQSEKLGLSLIDGLKENEATIYNGGSMAVDLTQTSYSTIPSIDVELGNQCSDHSAEALNKLGDGLLEGVNIFYSVRIQ